MAKSMRSKVKRSFRAKKREEGVYAAVEAARLQRLSAKLQTVRETDRDGDVELAAGEAEVEAEMDGTVPGAPTESMELEPVGNGSAAKTRISTHGPRGSRHEEWRAAKGLAPRPKSRGMNRQGGIAAKARSGRPKRRR